MLRIVLTYGCNNGCVFCPQSDLRAESTLLPHDPSAVIERDVRPGAVVALLGGEPTISPELFGLATLARSNGASDVIVQTNGRRLAYASYAAGLREAGASAVDVSLHGSTAPMHEAHTRTEGSFAQTVRGIGAAVKAGLRVGVTVVLTRSNVRHVAEIIQLVHARGVRRVHLANLLPVGAASLNAPRLSFAADIAAPHLAEARRVARSLRVEVTNAPDDNALEPIFVGASVPPQLFAPNRLVAIDHEASRA